MKETNSQGKACVVPLAVAASLGIAGMGLVSDGFVAADTVTDTINITVSPSCTFNSVEDKTYAGSATNGTEVNDFNDSGIHEFDLFCNNNSGFTVTATPYDLEATGINDVISYTDNYTHTGVDSMWTAEIASDSAVTVTSPVPIGGGTIISSGSSTAASGVSFAATYSAYVGSETPAGTYTGTIVYTLAASGSSNSGSNSGDSGNSGSETTDNTGNGGDSGNSGSEGGNSGGEETNGGENGGDSGDSGSGGAKSGGSGNEPQLMTTNNSYSTNNTYNTYNTTYSGGGTGTTGTQVAANGDTDGTTNGTTGENSNSKSGSGTNDGYEQPLGVTTSTSSSNEESGIDPLPIIITGAVLATAGVAAIALARRDKEEEEQEEQ